MEINREGPTTVAVQIFGPRCYNLSFDARGRAALAEQCYTQRGFGPENRVEITPNSQIFQDIRHIPIAKGKRQQVKQR